MRAPQTVKFFGLKANDVLMIWAPGEAEQAARDFDLRRLPPKFYLDPYPVYRALREREPVKRLPDGSLFLSAYDDLVAVYKDTATFSSDKREEFRPKYGDGPLYEHHTTSLVFNDPPLHTRVRKLIAGRADAARHRRPRARSGGAGRQPARRDGDAPRSI